MTSIAELARQDAPFVLVDERGLIVEVNAAFEALFGWPRAEVAGRPLTVIIPPALRDAHHLGFARFLATGAPTLLGRPLLLKVAARDGREFEAVHFIVAERGADGWRFGATIRPAA